MPIILVSMSYVSIIFHLFWQITTSDDLIGRQCVQQKVGYYFYSAIAW